MIDVRLNDTCIIREGGEEVEMLNFDVLYSTGRSCRVLEFELLCMTK